MSAVMTNGLIDDKLEEWKETKIIGIIGLGDMGLLYAEMFSQAGWKVVCCDRPEKYDMLLKKYQGAKFTVLKDGHLVSRISDYIIYSVETENIKTIVSKYGPSTKLGAIVGGQTSCKNYEIKAFEEFLPTDVDIISVHSLHGPKVNTEGQPLVIIDHRSSRSDSYPFVRALLSCLKSKIVDLTYEEHDTITADTQAVTHAAFLSMGLAWFKRRTYPWSIGVGQCNGGFENVKVNISLRIYSNKWHVYAGLAISNPAAHKQIMQYAQSTTDIFTLFIEGKKAELKSRVMEAKECIFGNHSGPLLLEDAMLANYSLSRQEICEDKIARCNSHLSLLAIVDSWHKLGVNPYDHMICSTPLFRIFVGVTEYLFMDSGLLEQTINTAIEEDWFRADDLEFVIAARTWSQIVSSGCFELYKTQFEEVQKFFEPMFPEATKVGNDMIKMILKNQG
ncbi:prephenate dehydrogenase (NADP(+)) Ecym_7090 [Eremothecium cymbalariae DBVPG|uniref:Prephenate dehydrogenase [NADP(+)] n=1 Tax=Eremothecium cymbalariae (strain CBS 270.75 / DBVPG 7215 / KCTC 17166 / NRRL Y-17582) TaxID=931890 RepID=G8JVS7_ERECY|nr:hypothetical protein Ecym_7090 [Eremothecium cymbalariae DBVPG\